MKLLNNTGDSNNIRKDFPTLNKTIKGRPIIYLDSACMSLKPALVIEAMNDYYQNYPACASRSYHAFGKKATEEFYKAREQISKFIHSRKTEEILFTRNTTEGLNLVANSIGLKKGDVVITTDREHNSNLLPWQLLSKKIGIKHILIQSKNDYTFDLDAFEKSMNKSVRLVSMVHTSNIDGYTLPEKEAIMIAHDFGSLVMLDAAQSVPHKTMDVKKLDADFLAFSGHKMLGPTGTGVLYGKYHLLEKMEPFMVGGNTVSNTTYVSHSLLKPPEKFEAGLQNYAGFIGLAAAVRYLERIGVDDIEKHETELNRFITEEIMRLPGLEIIGPEKPEMRSGIVSFNIKGIGYHDIAIMLNEKANIMIRSGQHCAHSWFNARGIGGCARVSLYLYNTLDEARVLVENIKNIIKLR